MVNLFGTDLDGIFDGVGGAIRSAVDSYSSSSRTTGGPDPLAQARQIAPQVQTDPFAGLRYEADPLAARIRRDNGFDPLAARFGGDDGFDPLMTGPSQNLFGLFYRARDSVFASNAEKAAAAAQKGTATQSGPLTPVNTGAGSGATGLGGTDARWANIDRYSDIIDRYGAEAGIDPDIFRAIMFNESGGDPRARHAGSGASGLLQLMPQEWQNEGADPFDPETNLRLGARLMRQKVAAVRQAYATNGIHADDRTLARDLALAWAGHFDYGSGRPNPRSADAWLGQTADQLSTVFLDNYDRLKQARSTQRPQGGASAPVTAEGYAFPVMGYSSPRVELHWGSEKGGADLFAPVGTPVAAMGNGVVIDAGTNSLGGNTVTLKLDNGLTVYMAHMRDAALVKAGQRVTAGQQLGFVGDTGNAKGTGAHLHIGIGYGIINGGGPTGGLGSGFDAYAWLNAILGQSRNVQHSPNDGHNH